LSAFCCDCQVVNYGLQFLISALHSTWILSSGVPTTSSTFGLRRLPHAPAGRRAFLHPDTLHARGRVFTALPTHATPRRRTLQHHFTARGPAATCGRAPLCTPNTLCCTPAPALQRHTPSGRDADATIHGARFFHAENILATQLFDVRLRDCMRARKQLRRCTSLPTALTYRHSPLPSPQLVLLPLSPYPSISLTLGFIFTGRERILPVHCPVAYLTLM